VRRVAATMMMTWARRIAIGVMAVLPLLAWPGLTQPFSTPKLYLLVITVIALAPCAWIAWRSHSHPVPPRTSPVPVPTHVVAAVWLASWTWSALFADIVSLDALLLALAGGGLAMVLTALHPQPAHLAAAHAVGATGVAIVAVMQWAGLDPFALAGWVAPLAGASPRLRIYGTLGNPNFVAALLAGAVPLTIGLIVHAQGQAQGRVQGQARGQDRGDAPGPTQGQAPDRGQPAATSRGRVGLGLRLRLPIGLIAVTLQILAIAATGSRAGALGLIVAGLTWILSGPPTYRRRVAIACVLAALAVIGVSTARPLRETLAGRIYIWQVVWPHAFEAPFVGQGPGAFALLYPAWEREARRKPPTAAAAHYFAGPQQYAHNDYLQALVERGLAGPVTLFLVLTTCLGGGRRAFRPRGPHGLAPDAIGGVTFAGSEPLRIGAAAALAALGAAALVDFPLARPAETALWWSCAALLGTPRDRPSG
jgi:putative inorganic carbon (hco3(-)) transporter